MLTLSGMVSAWAREAGRINEAMRQYRHELWHAREEAELGIVRSWDTAAILACEPGRHDLQELPGTFAGGAQMQHMRALIGASRAAINDHIAFEYVHEHEILEGLAGRYPVLYLPHVRACSDAVIERLLAYVEAGGRLVVDVQFALMDSWGKVRPRGEGTMIERLCGGWIDSIHDARTCPQKVEDFEIDCGFYGDFEITTSDTRAAFYDGRPAITDATRGRGRTTVLAFDPARMCHSTEYPHVERLLSGLLRGDAPRRVDTNAPICLRRRCDAADHWFLLNDGPAREVELSVHDAAYAACVSLPDHSPVHVHGARMTTHLPARSALWRRTAYAQQAHRDSGWVAIPVSSQAGRVCGA